MNYRSMCGLWILIITLTGCVARSAIILPSKYDREAAISNYQACVTSATTNYYDNVRTPEQIVQASFSSCQGQRGAMLSSYPRGWGIGLARDIDIKLYESELIWVNNKRN